MKKLLLTVFAIALFIGVNAQVTFGPKVGLNLAKFRTDVDGLDDAKMKVGAQIGIVTDISFSDAISLQTGLSFSQKGFKLEEDGETLKATYNYIEIPVHIVFGLNSGSNTLQFFTGPYAGIGLSGKFKSSIEGEDDMDVEFVSDLTDWKGDGFPSRRFDMGLNFGAGYKINNFQIQAQYGLGITNLIPTLDGEKSDNNISNSVFQFSVAYFIGN